MFEDEASARAPFRATKSFEGNGPFVVFNVSPRSSADGHQKFHLIADARPQTFGLRAEDTRGDDLKTGGAVVNLLRKHARTAGIGRAGRDPASGSIWLPLFTAGPEPTYWLELAKGSPPELRFLDAQGTILIRKSVQGTYTKRRTAEQGPPPFPYPKTFEDVTPRSTSFPGEPGEEEASAPAGEVLPDYQRSARDRLARRLKTAKKALEKQRAQLPTGGAIQDLERRAGILQSRLHEIKPEQFELLVEGEDSIPIDPEISPGANLQTAFENVKKAKRARVALTSHLTKSEDELAQMTEDLAKLRGGELPLVSVEAILKRHKLSSEKQAVRIKKDDDLSAKPYRVFKIPGDAPNDKPVEIWVGKGAADNDELCKLAKSNDYWLHAIGVTGSHVVIPARQLRGGAPPALLRQGAILALHFSKLRGDLKGEVYCTLRQHIRKRKGMAPGLWSVEKAETLFCRYEEAELQRLLATTAG